MAMFHKITLTCFVLLSSLCRLAQAISPTPEYRLISKKDGQEFKWNNGKVEKLESAPFMSGSDFLSATAKKSKNSNLAGKYEVELLHSESGSVKFRTVANRDREREYCILFKMTILQCFSFPPETKGLYEKGSIIYGSFSKGDAQKLASEIKSGINP